MRPALANRLKEATQEAHTTVDESLRLTGEHVHTADLVRAWSLLLGLCQTVDAHTPTEDLPWGPGLPRAEWLMQDLRWAGSMPRVLPLALREPVSPGWIGLHYVLEGSALGSAHLTRILARSRPDLPEEHYFARNASHGKRWPRFLRHLSTLPPETHSVTINAAVDLFESLAVRTTELKAFS